MSTARAHIGMFAPCQGLTPDPQTTGCSPCAQLMEIRHRAVDAVEARACDDITLFLEVARDGTNAGAGADTEFHDGIPCARRSARRRRSSTGMPEKIDQASTPWWKNNSHPERVLNPAARAACRNAVSCGV